MTLDMKKSCERCQAELKPDGAAFICSYECTYCSACAVEMKLICPNCAGELSRRPKRRVLERGERD